MIGAPTSFAFWLTTSLLCFAPAAGSDLAAAAEAFTHGQRAELAHEYARAAEFYELADSLAPSAQALRSAAKNRLRANQPAQAATQAAALTRRYPKSDKSQEIAKAILEQTDGQLARLTTSCDQPCLLSSDGRPIPAERALSHELYLEPGQHEITASFQSGQPSAWRELDVEAGQSVTLQFVAPAPVATVASPLPDNAAQRPPPPSRRRLHPAYFATGALVTAGLGATLVWSGLDVLNANRNYEDNPTRSGFENGQNAELRTNLLIAGTAVAAGVTVVLGVLTDWGRASRSNNRAASRPTQRVVIRPQMGAIEVRF